MDKKRQWLLMGAAALILVVVLVLCITSCKGEERQENAPRIGLCLSQYETDTEYGKLLQDSFQKAGYEVVIKDGKNDQTRQEKQIKDFLEEGAELLIIEPVMVDATEETVRLLMEKNVPAVFIGKKPETALGMWNRLSYVGVAEDQLGSLQGQILLQTKNQGDLNEDGQVSCLVLGGPEENDIAKQQADDCIGTLINAGLIVDRIETPWGEWTEESGRIRCAKALSQYGKDIEVIFCGNEAITLGALDAVKAGGWQIGRDYLLVGVGAEDKLQSDGMTGAVIYDRQGEAQQILSVAKELMEGKTVEQGCYVNLETVVLQANSE